MDEKDTDDKVERRKEINGVVLKGIDISIQDLLVIILKITLAALPSIVIIGITFFILSFVFSGCMAFVLGIFGS